MKRGQSFKVEENHLHQVLMVTLKKQRIRGELSSGTQSKTKRGHSMGSLRTNGHLKDNRAGGAHKRCQLQETLFSYLSNRCPFRA